MSMRPWVYTRYKIGNKNIKKEGGKIEEAEGERERGRGEREEREERERREREEREREKRGGRRDVCARVLVCVGN